MKKLLLFFVTFYLSIQITNATTYHVLYLGNSLTYVNDVPSLVNQIAISKGDTIIWDQNTPGGHQLAQHAANAISLSKISAYKWDIVVIQAQSQQTAFPDGQLELEVYPPCKFLVDSIHRNNPCTRVMYYMPAGWKYGDNMNCAGFPDICTYEGQFARIRQTHLNMIDSTDASIIPSGVSYRVSRLQDSTLDLWSGDNVHPSMAGSYLTALNMYACFTKKATFGSTYIPAGLTALNTEYLQNIADTVVFDSMSRWKLNAIPANLLNSCNISSKLVDHSGIDMNKLYALVVDDALAQYQTISYYYRLSSIDPWILCSNSNDTVFLNDTLCFDNGQLLQVVESCNKQDSLIVDVFEPCFLNVDDAIISNTLSIYPNPTSDKLIIKNFSTIFNQENVTYTILDMNGKICKSSAFVKNESIDVHLLTNGLYYIIIKSGDKEYRLKFSKS